MRNSYYVDDIRRARELAAKKIHYVDVGTSGGVWGLERGYCMMIGGEPDVVRASESNLRLAGTSSAQRNPPHARPREASISIFASEAGNLALKVMATGGIYLGGGVPPHLLSALEKPGFMESFKRKGRFADLMGRIPVHVILNRAALVGTAAYGLGSFIDGA